jgi:hypothetical protein
MKDWKNASKGIRSRLTRSNDSKVSCRGKPLRIIAKAQAEAVGGLLTIEGDVKRL